MRWRGAVAVAYEFFILESSSKESLGVHGFDLALGTQPVVAAAAFKVVANVVVMKEMLAAAVADEWSIK